MKRTVILLTAAILIGCQQDSQYELTTEGGKIYRLNNRTGEIAEIEGSKIIPLDEPTSDMAKEAVSRLREPMTWPQIDLPQLDSLNLNLRTRWREGYLHFIFSVSPYNKRLREAQESYPSSRNFKLNLLDSSGFLIVQKQIDISDLTRVVDQKGKATGMQLNSKIPCTAETYLAIEYWTCGWQL